MTIAKAALEIGLCGWMALAAFVLFSRDSIASGRQQRGDTHIAVPARRPHYRAVSPLNLFGLAAVSAMLVLYALEERASLYVLGFAVACALGSVYGFLQGAWPFGIVEAIWAAVAVRRWRMRRQR